MTMNRGSTYKHDEQSDLYLKDKNLTLKAKGIMAILKSMPDEYSCTVKGLSDLCNDGISSIASGLKELEKQGYLSRNIVRNDSGYVLGTKYTITKIIPNVDFPNLDFPNLDFPNLDFPNQDNPNLDFHDQDFQDKTIPEKELIYEEPFDEEEDKRLRRLFFPQSIEADENEMMSAKNNRTGEKENG